MTSSAIYAGQVMHRRLRPRMHQLKYRIFSLLLDLDELEALDGRLRFFSRARFNLLAFYDRDHGDGSAMPLRDQALAQLRRAGIELIGRIRLLAMPRLLGFVFNPLSIYFCDSPNGTLAAILYEVHNTFGQRHCYVLPVDSPGGTIRQEIGKRFHVSPFLPMNLDYAFRVKPPADAMLVAISVSDENGPILAAVHSAWHRPLTDAMILRTVAASPMMTLKVVAGILWDAARLALKGVKMHPRPVAPGHGITARSVRSERTPAKAA